MSQVFPTRLSAILTEIEQLHPHGNLQLNDSIVNSIYNSAESIAQQVVNQNEQPRTDWDKRIDDILTSRVFGFPSMLLLLGMIFWMTVAGANVPSAMLADTLFWGQDRLTELCNVLHAPAWFHGLFIEGVYSTLAWVISVMLPPMAIFFPCFTLLEDLGYLPRVAFNLDRLFKKAGAHGKQSLTMSMGFGCNAAGL
ncbi:hypothetical protein N752_16540 [Desulforamulus aquiferis]|nr:hypothetical protein N752_16540 [Desulforamulus aquiferis]